jgi:hypothetical protein
MDQIPAGDVVVVADLGPAEPRDIPLGAVGVDAKARAAELAMVAFSATWLLAVLGITALVLADL